MAFSESVKLEAWKRTGVKCEKFKKQLVWDNHNDGERGEWKAHHKTAVASGDKDILSNCMILCFDCHKTTRTYGKH